MRGSPAPPFPVKCARQSGAPVPGEVDRLSESAVRLVHFVAPDPGDVLRLGHPENFERQRIDEPADLALVDDCAAIRMQVVEQAFPVFRQECVKVDHPAQARGRAVGDSGDDHSPVAVTE